MTEGHLRHLDRTELELVVVQIGSLPDAQRALIARHVDQVVVLPSDLATVRAALAELAPDVVVLADIGLTPISHFLAFDRYAPLQLVLPALPVPTGLPGVHGFYTPR